MSARFESVYEQLSRHELTQVQAAAILHISTRTLRRRIVRHRAEGLKGVEAGRVSGASLRQAPSSEVTALETLYTTLYSGSSVLSFYRTYQEAHCGRRSYSWVKKHLQLAGLVPRRTNKACSELVQGTMLHQWVWRYRWIPGETWDLIVTADDATGRVYSGFFAHRHTLWSGFRGVREILTAKGFFGAICAPWAADCWDTPGATQFRRAMEEMVIEVVRSPPPPASKRCNRVFATLRWLLPWQLAHAQTTKPSDANKFLRRYWPRFNGAFALKCEGDEFDPLRDSAIEGLDDILCLKERVVVRCDNCVYGGRQLQMPTSEPGVTYEGQEVDVYEYEDGRIVIRSGSDVVGGSPIPDR